MRRSPRARAGTSLPAVLIGVTLSTLAVALLGRAMVDLLRHAHRLHAREQARAQLGQAAGVLAAELRGATALPSPTDVADLLLVADTAVEVRAPVGGGVACATGGDYVEVLESVATGAPAVGWWSDAPEAGDVVHVHDEGAQPTVRDDAWHARDLVAVEHSATACATGPFAPWRAAGAQLRLRLAGAALPATVSAGAPVRVTRRRRYVHYRAGDGTWQLGQREWSAALGALQPVAGPLASRSAQAPGLSVVARDAGRLDVVARVELAFPGARWRDSAVVRAPLDTGRAP
ncbi:PulJ/GspJ family protein [Roseisolibacter agri]|uniref:Uncharacterized protein n=1 Tax=Roseisolibacter agri TaxID=2014610 RepID=A0AA37V8K9_9BACT|nr:hypothetical protein [Roseisolibacter agri]GLC27896.1 hypothetical protein rosag_44090 [Roseisolibacter agri]